MNKVYYAVVALLSCSIIAVEMIWTKIFSAEFFYTYAFLILSLAVLGLGLGALAIRLFEKLYKESLIGAYLTLSGLLAMLTPVLVIQLHFSFNDLFKDFTLLWNLAGIVVLLFLPFFFAGMALAVIFRKYTFFITKLYMYDLACAGLGVFLAFFLMNNYGTPAAVYLAVIPLLIAAVLAQPKWLKLFPIIFIIAAVVMLPSADKQLTVDRPERAPVIYTHWDAMAKVKIYDYADEYRGLNIDNIANSPLIGFDGDFNVPDSEKQWSIDVSYLIQQFDSCTFLSLGAGGGGDVLQALLEGATDIHAVEVNGHLNEMMTVGDLDGYIPEALNRVDTIIDRATGDTTIKEINRELISAAEFTGNIYHDPRVKVVTEDARTYVKRYRNTFDVIYSLSSNTWAALASGAFSLAENYIFTTEAYEDYWQSLSDSGFMMMEHQFYMPRLVTEIKTALLNQGIENYKDHFAIYDLPQMRRKMLLLSKRPLTDSLRYYAFGPLTQERYPAIHLLYPPHDSVKGNQVERIIVNGWESEQDSARIDLSPSTDNRPFVAQLGMWKNFDLSDRENLRPYEFLGFPLSKLAIVAVLLIIIALIIPLNLVPYIVSKEKLSFAPWMFFFLIGFSFMALEVVLIQKYMLFIGVSLDATGSVLMTLLIASGIGSRFADKFSDAFPFIAIFAWFILDYLFFSIIADAGSSLPLGARSAISCLMIMPLGFFMGMPFPKGAKKVGELVDWGFAVNGAASVLGATMVILIALSYGFTVSMMVAVIGYLLAMIMLIITPKVITTNN